MGCSFLFRAALSENLLGDVVLTFSADGGFEGGYQWVLVPQMKLLGQMIGGQLKKRQEGQGRQQRIHRSRHGQVAAGAS